MNRIVFTNVYNPRSTISRKNEYRDTLVKQGVTMGANCTIVCGVTIEEYVFIGAGAVVNRDVKAYVLMVGVPVRQIGWISRFGEQLELPLNGENETFCSHSGDRYLVRDGICHVVSPQISVCSVRAVLLRR